MTGGAAAAAPLREVFWSIQGEGRFVGTPMVFVRTAKCPIRCHYCDTPDSFIAEATASVRSVAGKRREPNPVTGARAAALALEVAPAPTPRLSVTGGEPLLYPEFVAALAAELRPRGVRVHLETAALHPGALQQVVGYLDHLSADYKLPGTLERGDFAAQHRACIALGVAAGLTVDVKLVLTPAVRDTDFDAALDELRDLRADLALILQPVTPFGAVAMRPAASTVTARAAAAAARGFDVRVIPQTHRDLGVD